MSAIISCESRRVLRARLDMNSARSVRSTPSSTSFCTLSMRNMRITTSMANESGSSVSTRAAWSARTFDSTTATVCGYSFFR